MELNRPKPFNPNKNQIGKDWQLWRNEFLIYLRLSRGYDKYSEEERALLLMNLMGTEAIRTMEQMSFDHPNEKNDMDILIMKFNEIFDRPLNEVEQRYKFFSRRIGEGESIENYVTDLKQKASSCNFGTQTEKFIIDMLIRNLDSYLQNIIFALEDITLTEIMQHYKQFTISNEKIKELTRNASKNMNSNNSEDSRNSNSTPVKQTYSRCCWRCETQHVLGLCPAYGKICNVCNEKHHYHGLCRRQFRGSERSEEFKSKRICSKCGINHPFKQCPAYHETCHKCHVKGHYTSQCKRKESSDAVNKNHEASNSSVNKQNEGQNPSDNKFENCLCCESKHYQGQCRHAASCKRCDVYVNNTNKSTIQSPSHGSTNHQIPEYTPRINDARTQYAESNNTNKSTIQSPSHGSTNHQIPEYTPRMNNARTQYATADPLLNRYIKVEPTSSHSTYSKRTTKTGSTQNRNNFQSSESKKPDACNIS